MNLGIYNEYIPGSVLKKHDMGNVTGREFLNKIFYITDGIMLSQIREITGVDGSTLQNWVKRGWVANTVNKKYTKDHLARILIINMLRDTLMLERIDFLLKYINGSVNNREDDIIPESQLYGYICDITDCLMSENKNIIVEKTKDESEKINKSETLQNIIKIYTEDYVEKMAGARRRLHAGLEIIVIAYYASSIQAYSNNLFDILQKKG